MIVIYATKLVGVQKIHVGTNDDGRLEVFVQGSDNHLWHIYQVKAGEDWSDWYDLTTDRNLPVGIISLLLVNQTQDPMLMEA